jgi:hypothetical protein
MRSELLTLHQNIELLRKEGRSREPMKRVLKTTLIKIEPPGSLLGASFMKPTIE